MHDRPRRPTAGLEKGITLVSNDYGDRTQFLYDGINEVKPDMIKEATANARASASNGSSVAVFGSMSMKMGTQPKKRIARQVAKNV